jgi:TatD DNase family protein
MHPLVDTHCHLDVPEFDEDRDAVVARARAAGVTRQIVPAIEAATWPGLRDVCARDEGLFPAYGLHPLLIAQHRESHLRELRDWIERERPVAVGECGLDYFIEGLDHDTQAGYFDAQLALAREFDLPVVVHARRALDAVIAAIKRVGKLRGVIHSYPGSEEQARQLADLGFLVGIGGPVTYERANRVRRVAAHVPLDTLLLETDAPDQPDTDHRGQRNEPARIVRVLEVIAALRDEDPGVIARATSRNAERLFGLPALASA